MARMVGIMNRNPLTRLLLICTSILAPVWLAADEPFHTPDRDKYDPEKDASEKEESLPDVLLIGDSIMGGYFRAAKTELAGEANVSRHPGNAGDTRNGLKKIDSWLGDTKWDVIHFNWGLHDLCHRHPESRVYGNRDKERGTLAVSPEDYGKNLENLVKRLEKTGAKLIWATTTTVPEGEAGRFVGDDDKYNAVAAKVMEEHGIPTNDLNALTDSFGPGMFSKPKDVHFSGKGNTMLAKQVAEAVRKHGLAKDE